MVTVSVCLLRKCEKRMDFEMVGCCILVGFSRQINSFVGGELSLVISCVIEPNKKVCHVVMFVKFCN